MCKLLLYSFLCLSLQSFGQDLCADSFFNTLLPKKTHIEVLKAKTSSVLYIAPSNQPEYLVKKIKFLKKILYSQLSGTQKPGEIAIITAHQIPLLEQIAAHLQQGTKKLSSNRNNGATSPPPPFSLNYSYNNTIDSSHFAKDIKKATLSKQPTVFLVLAQNLKKQLEHLDIDTYYTFKDHIRWFFVDKMDDLDTYKTEDLIWNLAAEEDVFLTGFTETQQHEFWKPLFVKNHFESKKNSHSPVTRSPSVPTKKSSVQPRKGSSILIPDILTVRGRYNDAFPNKETVDSFLKFAKESQRGKVPTIEDMYIIGNINFRKEKYKKIFVLNSTNHKSLNALYFTQLVQKIRLVVQNHNKGLIIIPTVEDAQAIQKELATQIKNIKFEVYHSRLPYETQANILKNMETPDAQYIITTQRNALHNLKIAQLDLYINLNINLSLESIFKILQNVKKTNMLLLVDYHNLDIRADLLTLMALVEHDQSRKNQKQISYPPMSIVQFRKRYLLADYAYIRDYGFFLKERQHMGTNLKEFTKSVRLTRTQGFTTREEYEEWIESTSPKGVPYNPEILYHLEWRGWDYYLGIAQKQ